MFESSSSEEPVQQCVGDLLLVSSGEVLGESRGKVLALENRPEVVMSSTMSSSSSSSSSLGSDLVASPTSGELLELSRRRERGLRRGLRHGS